MKKLGWVPKYDLKMLVKEMIASYLKLFQKDIFIEGQGSRDFKSIRLVSL